MNIKVIVLLLLTPIFIYSQRIGIGALGNSTYENESEKTSECFLPLIAGSVALTGFLIVTDDATYEIMQDGLKQSSFLKHVSPIVTQLGDGKFSLALFSGVGLYHFITGDKKTGDAALLGLESFFVSGISIQILKHTFGRERPSHSTVDGGKWNGPFISQKGHPLASFDAFPSGHTATIFAAASALSYVYPDGVIPYISYGVASLVSLSRVTESTHWLSDCFVGALIGYFSTQLIISLNKSNSKFDLGVINQNESYAIQITYTL
ncbi:MAG: phosphatase PAP2 family protein [Ignavibacteriaceae bacterium]|nr:phosphatase PAP2 family protein [Ignavibacteriaceae bacterium]HRN26140.1 phosphatase PAP2 family protein [Ignavibacteriaceae bacterium]HRP92908.1 phosphatase PAP2 family protein [Ignavibacteriaceae bacterium]HRQ53777.1 phosphatase PAP2 family protein [Ignavibacteriaceae bacterium]